MIIIISQSNKNIPVCKNNQKYTNYNIFQWKEKNTKNFANKDSINALGMRKYALLNHTNKSFLVKQQHI